MSLATRCTHCGTIFKVVQDQLKVSEGWVRCGRCNEVFNALPALFDLEKDPPPPKPAHLTGGLPDGAPAASSALAESPPTEAPAEHTPTETAAHITAPQPSSTPDLSNAALGVTLPTPAPAVHHSPDPLIEQGLMDEANVDLGFDSKPPVGWEPTQPADITQHMLDEDALALEPQSIEATTDFELDTSIAVDDNTPLEDVIASMSPRSSRPAPQPAPPAAPDPHDVKLDIPDMPRPWLDEPPEDVPSTDEEDALDSRYLTPTTREPRKAPRRRDDGPEFADAQFPSDAFIDAEEDWASDFGPSALEADDALPPHASAAPTPSHPQHAATAGLRAAPALSHDTDLPPEPAEEPEDERASDFGANIAPEHSIDPPTTRKGRRLLGKRAQANDDADAVATPEFVKRAQRKAFWRHPAMRALLSVVALGLALTLCLQLVHQFRDLFAAYYPASRPYLAQWCEAAGCKLSPPLRIEELQLESNALIRTTSEGPDSYRLAVVVHNKSAIELAWPHIDLILNDENGAVIARRVFDPKDAQWLDTADPKANTPTGPDTAAAPMPAAVPSERSTTLQWRLLAPNIKPAGYTIDLFYP